MKIGIIVYSQTGNTLLAAQKLKDILDRAGHEASVEQVTIVGEASPRDKNVELASSPAVASYDALVLGAPVHAFSLAPAMQAYLQQLSALQNKTTACFVTKQLPFKWTGGSQALGKMKEICAGKGAEIAFSEVIFCSPGRRENSMEQFLQGLAAFFKT